MIINKILLIVLFISLSIPIWKIELYALEKEKPAPITIFNINIIGNDQFNSEKIDDNLRKLFLIGGRLKISDNNKVQTLIKKSGFSNNKCNTEECILKTSSLLKGKFAISGEIIFLDKGKISINISLYDVLDRSKIYSIIEKSDSQENIHKAIITLGLLIKNKIEARAVQEITSIGSSDTNFIKLTWISILINSEYEILRSDKQDGQFKKIGQSLNKFYKDKDIIKGQPYYYQIRTILSNSNLGKLSEPIYAINRLPGPDIKIDLNEINKIRLTWEKNKTTGSYEIYRSTEPNMGFRKIFNTEKNYFIDYNIIYKKRYYYYVKGILKGIDTDKSVTVSGVNQKTYRGLYFRSIIPGWGQFYLDNNLRGYLFMGTAAVTGSFLIWSAFYKNRTWNSYKDLPYGTDTEVFDSKWSSYKNSVYIFFGAVTLFSINYIGNWIDVLFFNKTSNNKSIEAIESDKKISFSIRFYNINNVVAEDGMYIEVKYRF